MASLWIHSCREVTPNTATTCCLVSCLWAPVTLAAHEPLLIEWFRSQHYSIMGTLLNWPCSHPVSSSSSVIQQAWWETGKDSDELPINHFLWNNIIVTCDLPPITYHNICHFQLLYIVFVNTFLSCPLPNQCLTIDSRVVWLCETTPLNVDSDIIYFSVCCKCLILFASRLVCSVYFIN